MNGPQRPSHIKAAEDQLQFFGGWFAHPIFINGQYPPIMRDKVSISTQNVTFTVFANKPCLYFILKKNCCANFRLLTAV